MPSSYRRIPYRPDEEEFVRTPEAGRRLGLTTHEVFRLIDLGTLRIAVDDRGLARVPAADLDDYLRRSA
jgi:hypothetical protein